MRAPLVAAAWLAFAGQARAAPADPLAAELEKAKAEGFSMKRKLVVPAPWGGRLATYVFSNDAEDFDRLRTWHVKGGKAALVYYEASSSQRIEPDAVHAQGRLPDLYGDGSRALAYTVSGAGRTQLRLVRFLRGGAVPERTPLPGGVLQDLDGDGRPEVLSRSTPLGRFLTIECGGFFSMAQEAQRTTIYELRDGKLSPASLSHARWFDGHIAQLEGELAGLDPRNTRRYGDYLSAALSLYFDFAEKGLPRQGWSRFSELFRPSSGDPRPVADCIFQVRGDLRRRLNVPEQWE
ncbi:MAG: hypothetical protein HY554_16830 [Elusimicrobia bacterium]|nr:hypothetical protein [Elusimicrobiota bacterium]